MNNRDKEEEIIEKLRVDVGTTQKIVELLEMRRERYKNSLEEREDPLQRGKSQECRDLIKLFTQ